MMGLKNFQGSEELLQLLDEVSFTFARTKRLDMVTW